MVEPIQSQPSFASSAMPDVPDMAHKMQKLLLELSGSLHQLVNNPSLADDHSFQRDFAEGVITPLNEVVKKSATL